MCPLRARCPQRNSELDFSEGDMALVTEVQIRIPCGELDVVEEEGIREEDICCYGK